MQFDRTTNLPIFNLSDIVEYTQQLMDQEMAKGEKRWYRRRKNTNNVYNYLYDLTYG